jgi:hypothetical protein
MIELLQASVEQLMDRVTQLETKIEPSKVANQ